MTLSGSLSLSLAASYSPAIGTVITILDNQTALPIIGTFDNLSEGAILSVSGVRFRISYVGQSGANDVTLTVVPWGRVWDDHDHDGIQDAGEFNITNVQILLLDASGNVIATTSTDLNGSYAFAHVSPSRDATGDVHLLATGSGQRLDRQRLRLLRLQRSVHHLR